MKILAGLGLLFFGIKLITRSLGAMAGDRFRQGIERASRRSGTSALFGVLAGFVMQSGRTTSFVMASFVQAGLIEVRRALPIVLWANFGCTFMLFAAVFPMSLIVLVLLAGAGICVAFERPKSYQNAATATFGLALMLFGLQMMSSSASSLVSAADFGLTVIVQSHLAVALVAVSLAGQGVFDLRLTLMAIYGAQAGASVITYITGVHFVGRARQVVLAQVFYNLIGVAIFAPLTLVCLLAWPTRPPPGQTLDPIAPYATAAALGATLLLNFATPLLLTLMRSAVEIFCARLSPPVPAAELARPAFLRNEVHTSAVATLMLAEQEQLRLLQRMPNYCAWLRDEPDGLEGPHPTICRQAFVSVSQTIERFQRGMMALQMSAEETEWLLNQQKRQELLTSIDEACFALWEAARVVDAATSPLRSAIVESLDLLLMSAIEAMARGDAEELELLESLTRNNGTAMERVRRLYLDASDSLSADGRSLVLQLTSLFERAAWALRRFGALLGEGAGPSLEQREEQREAIFRPHAA